MTRRAPNPVAGELTGYFLTGDADQGLSSSWGPLAAIALGGFGGSPDPERRADDRRFGLGPARRSAVTRAREVRAALLSLDPKHVAALWAAHGPTPWLRVIDQAFGRGMSIKVSKCLGDLAAVALLTPALARAFAAAPEPEEKARLAWKLPGGCLVALCLDKSEAGKARIGAVKEEAAGLLKRAEAAYVVARLKLEPRRKLKPARKAPEPRFDPFPEARE